MPRIAAASSTLPVRTTMALLFSAPTMVSRRSSMLASVSFIVGCASVADVPAAAPMAAAATTVPAAAQARPLRAHGRGTAGRAKQRAAAVRSMALVWYAATRTRRCG